MTTITILEAATGQSYRAVYANIERERWAIVEFPERDERPGGRLLCRLALSDGTRVAGEIGAIHAMCRAARWCQGRD